MTEQSYYEITVRGMHTLASMGIHCNKLEKREAVTINGGENRITWQDVKQKAELLSKKYPFLTVGVLGKSFRGRDIYILSMGKGEGRFLYVGAHHGAEGITSGILIRYAEDMCRIIANGGKMGGALAEEFLKGKRIDIVPMLNPDGVEMSVSGVPRNDIMYDRLVKMNGGEDFTLWQANGRGVDLNHNYNMDFAGYKLVEKKMGIEGGAKSLYSGEYPESEPEVLCLCRYLRIAMPENVISLHTQGEEIYYSSMDEFLEPSYKNALLASRMTGYRISVPEGSAAYGGLLDYLTRKLGIPCLTLECGRGKNPLDPSAEGIIYSQIKSLLISAPVAFCKCK